MITAFADPRALAEALADYVAGAINARLERSSHCAIAVSGGKTPTRFFQALSMKDLHWNAVAITLVDDRWVSETSVRSNALLVKEHLLRGHAAKARFVTLVDDAASPEAGRSAAERKIANLPLPFAAVVLGMGLDGHTASIFADGDRLDEALYPSRGQRVETMRAASAPEARITLTMPVLLEAGQVFIHIEGEAKRQALDSAFLPGPVAEMPVRAILRRAAAPNIFWSP